MTDYPHRDGQLSDILFSIVIVCYNQDRFVRQTVESSLDQEFPGKEVIVVDDCSSDSTVDVLNTFGDSIILARLPINRGVAAARNHGASLASGEYLVFLDGDDVLMPWALETYRRCIVARHPKLMFGRCLKFRGKLPQADPPRDLQFIEYENFFAKDRPCVFNTSTLVVDRCTFWAADGWSPNIFYQDIQDLMTKLGTSGKMILVLTPDTVWYRMHSTNAVNKISPFVEGIYVLLGKARAGLYPGGQERWVERSAWFGGLIFYWTKTAMRAGLFRDGFFLLITGWWMILVAIIRRSTAWLVGRKPVEILPWQRD
ncbi:MAG TPA: glycosyltransferase family 2 protein [Terriglobales bacterium]|nr:glycosyltransferase family 2 protein [Terriglobales bacterium]